MPWVQQWVQDKGAQGKGATKGGGKGQGKAAGKGKGAWENDREWHPQGWPCKVKGCQVCDDGVLNWNSRKNCKGCGAPRATVQPLLGQPKGKATGKGRQQYIPGAQPEMTRSQRRNAARRVTRLSQEQVDEDWGQVDELEAKDQQLQKMKLEKEQLQKQLNQQRQQQQQQQQPVGQVAAAAAASSAMEVTAVENPPEKVLAKDEMLVLRQLGIFPAKEAKGAAEIFWKTKAKEYPMRPRKRWLGLVRRTTS